MATESLFIKAEVLFVSVTGIKGLSGRVCDTRVLVKVGYVR